MIASLRQSFNYDDTNDYRLVVLYTNPRCDVRAPFNGFIKHLNYMDFMEECEINDFCKEEFVVKGRTIFIPVPCEYHKNYELVNIFLKRIQKAAIAIINKRLDPEIKILIHEHALCIGQKCIWQIFVKKVGTMGKWTYPYDFHIVRAKTMFLNGCKEVIGDIEFYGASNPYFEVE